MKRYILALDQSTTSTKAYLVNKAGHIVHKTSEVHRQFYPKTDWVEQDAAEIWNLTVKAMKRLITESGVNEEEIGALAITVQTGAFVVWDKCTGEPVHKMIGWQCGRGASICERFSPQEAGIIKEKTGDEPSPYLPAAKLAWMFETYPELKPQADSGELLYGSVDSWLIWKLTGGRVHASDYSNACASQLFDIKAQRWDDYLMTLFGVPKAMMPETLDSNAVFGTVEVSGLPRLPILSVIGDSYAAAFGQCLFEAGNVKVTYGTGASILLILGDTPVETREGLTPCIGWRIDGKPTYVWEGTSVCSGAVISWLVNNLGLLAKAAESETVAAGVADTGGVYFVPAFTGLSAPYNDSEAKACIQGMTMSTQKAHIVRAALESIAYQIADLTFSIVRQTEKSIPRLMVDGGVTENNLVMQFQADILGIPVCKSSVEESSALGVAYLAGLGCGLWQNFDELKALNPPAQIFTPQMAEEQAKVLYQGWQAAVLKAKIEQS